MATVWAKQNGNWTSTSIWAFWNEATQQIEDYGQMPQIDDVVYCNGHTITFGGTVLTVKELHNDLNPYTQNEGGSINRTATGATISFNCDFFGNGNTTILNGAGNGIYYIINGNVNDAVIVTGTYQQSTTINGNCKNTCSSGLAGGLYKDLTINGNVLIEEGRRFFLSTASAGTQDTRMTINGILSQFGDIAISIGVYTTTIYGKYIVGNGVSFNSNMTLYGEVDLTRNNNKVPMVGNYGLNLKTDSIVTPLEGDYPAETDVKKDIPYAYGQMVGTYAPEYPPESVVLKDYEYGDSDDRKTGTMEQEVNVEVGCVTPEDVRKDVPLVGMGVVGSLVVPSVDDVREGVVFDNGSVGTLIVEGGGDRLRIANFGYYTNAQSDTYIVDLTEQDKPKFAVAEERVLIEMFPDLDLDNIPDKYFDDLFVKYLKYRLIVEYYRTAGINSTFTPSEPTTEIVNYQNVRNEVWLNSANIYLKAWAKKYPESIVKPQRILL